MNDTTTENIKDFEYLDKILADSIDKEIISQLEYYLEIARKKSKALASSLQRCFNNARKSMRYVLVYNLGKEHSAISNQQSAISNQHVRQRTDPPGRRPASGGQHSALNDEELEKYLKEYLKDYFEKNDFMHYREFVRLLRACTIDAGIDVSSHIKEMYNDFFLGKRLITAYKLGKKQ